VRRLVDHVIDVQRAIPEGLGMAVTDVPDPKATWKAVRDGAMTVLRQPGVLEQTMPGRSGEMPVEMSLGIRVGDLLVHTWDLARATGGDEQLDADTAALVLERIKPNDELLRSSGTFGPKLDPPPGADAAVELLCFTGRRP
jgi:uncharacterized protein (TIGR03086 family)